MVEVGLLHRVRERLATEPGATADGDLAALILDESSMIADETALAGLSRGVSAQLVGAGPLEGLLDEEGVTDVLVNSPDEIWVDRGGGLQRAAARFRSEAEVRRLAQRLAAGAGRRLDDAVPYVDAALPDGTRLHAVIPPVSPHTVISLRVLARRQFRLEELADPALAELLTAIVAARLAFLVTGGTGTGKTTLLGSMLARCDPAQRLLVIEDARELVVEHPHVVRLLCRTANVEGGGVVELRDLVRQSLRMRPDRIVVGEFRGAEMAELMLALNTGHEGGAATLHANSADDVPARLIALGALAGLSAEAVMRQLASAFSVVVHLQRAGRRRRVHSVALLDRSGQESVVVPIWTAAAFAAPEWSASVPSATARIGASGRLDPVGAEALSRRLAARGVELPELLRC
ncbi:pilus assembly protein CpaF [Frankineae bacterium MT45]|nr:pilus assembly protein CpaF [Frankineae bacterium MT45]